MRILLSFPFLIFNDNDYDVVGSLFNPNTNIGEIHYHKENKANGGKQIEFSAGSNQSEKKSKVGINEMFSNC